MTAESCVTVYNFSRNVLVEIEPRALQNVIAPNRFFIYLCYLRCYFSCYRKKQI